MGKSLKGKELGEGITQRKDGVYIARFTNRFGKRIKFEGANLKSVKEKLADAIYENKMHANVVENCTLDEWYEIWLNIFKKGNSESTKSYYAIQYNRMKQDLGWQLLSDLNIVNIQNCFNDMVSDSARKKSKVTLCDMLDKAVLAERLLKNPAKNIVTKITNEEKAEKRILNVDEEKLVLEFSKDNSYYHNPIAFMLETGLRIGEIGGLKWSDIDFEKKCVSIQRSLSRITGRDGTPVSYVLKEPKTKSGYRTIPLTKKAIEILENQKLLLQASKTIKSFNKDYDDIVFLSSTNELLRYRTFVSHLEDTIIKGINKKKPDFKKFTCHSLRHTFATRCIERGMNPKSLQKILGHSTLAQTMDTYVHATDDLLFREMEKFETA